MDEKLDKEEKEKRKRTSQIAPLHADNKVRIPGQRLSNQLEAPKSPTRGIVRKQSDHTNPVVRIPKVPRNHSIGVGESEKRQQPLIRPASVMGVSSFGDRDEMVGRKRTRIRIKTSHKTFVCALIEKGMVEHSVNKQEEEYIWQRFELGSEAFITLKSFYNRYLSADKGGKLVTSRTRKNTEVFTVEPLPNAEKKYALKTFSGEYVCALPVGTLMTNRFGPQAWETFEIEEEPFAPPVFGGNLNDIVVYQLKNGLYSQVPHVLEVLADIIKSHEGHTTEGIFRISGDGSAVMKYRSEIQKGNYDCKIDNCHDAATLFKLFLRELSEPVFPDHYYSTALRLAEEQNITGMQEMITKFDNINLKVIQFVANFLRSFLKPEFLQRNMMPANNLATVFAPTLLRCPSDNPLMQITASSSEVKFVLMLLEHFPEDLKENV